ncbi:hypothetical protein [Actinoplanes sp. NPDC020271]|uniref:hypothetical protein n=1 Tax=Actinoplanes sp. NPDC020271 TaxID=3363896 RepID=UPI003788D43F
MAEPENADRLDTVDINELERPKCAETDAVERLHVVVPGRPPEINGGAARALLSLLVKSSLSVEAEKSSGDEV